MSTASPTGGNLDTVLSSGRPAAELSDEELEAQGTQAHATRNWVFLHGTAEQFARHTSRMLELEQEYLRRYPHRTWQGSGGAGTDPRDEAAALRAALRGIVAQLDALATEPPATASDLRRAADPALGVLSAVATAPGGRLHKLEVHQAAREARLDRTALAGLYQSDPPLLAVDGQDRVITAAGRERLAGAGRRSTPLSTTGTWDWVRLEDPTWNDDVARIVGGAADGSLGVSAAPGDPLSGDWWAAVEPDGHVVGYGWMDVGWGEAEVLLAVESDAQGTGVGSFVLDHLETEAASRGLNYVYNTVRASHPDRDAVADWLAVRGYSGDVATGPLRKHVAGRGAPAVGAMAPGSAADGASPGPTTHVHDADRDDRSHGPGAGDRGPGAEESGGYVDVDDHSY